MLSTSLSGLAALYLATISSASPFPANNIAQRQDTTACEAVHIFLARGWNVSDYPGRQGALAGSICYGLDSCGYEDIYYYNLDDVPYCQGVTDGVANGTAAIKDYAARCPDSQIVLSGYSQGANVVGNILGGGGGEFSNCTIAETSGLDVNSAAGKQIAVVTLFGDPLHVGGEYYNVLGGAPYNSSDPRDATSLAKLNQYAPVLRSYCQESDPICAGGGPGPFNISDHLNYFELYTQVAAGWIKWVLENPQK